MAAYQKELLATAERKVPLVIMSINMCLKVLKCSKIQLFSARANDWEGLHLLLLDRLAYSDRVLTALQVAFERSVVVTGNFVVPAGSPLAEVVDLLPAECRRLNCRACSVALAGWSLHCD